jgi:hypothetical protein
MRPTLPLVTAAGLVIGLAGAVLAAPLDGRPKILLHVKIPNAKNACTAWGTLADCREATVRSGLSTPAGPYFYAYLMAARGNLPTLAGLQCGITYQAGQAGGMNDGIGIDIFAWTLCATLEFITPETNAWPRPGGGNLITWDPVNTCQAGDVAVAGYFYLGAYSSDVLRVLKRPVDNSARVADCLWIEPPPLEAGDLGFAAFSAGGAEPGCNPCLIDCLNSPMPVTPTTWGGVKALIGS